MSRTQLSSLALGILIGSVFAPALDAPAHTTSVSVPGEEVIQLLRETTDGLPRVADDP